MPAQFLRVELISAPNQTPHDILASTSAIRRVPVAHAMQLPSLSRFFHLSRFQLLMILFAGVAPMNRGFAQNRPEWTEPYPPFHIAGPLYHVGTKDLAVYLIATPAGCILINSTLEENVPQIRANLEQLGFAFSDVKILLISHAHWDHCAASARIKELTGAAYMVMEGDVDVVESGGRTDFNYGDTASTYYPPTRVDRVLHDGDTVTLGGVSLVAHRTAGHTKGCTTWTMKVSEGGKDLNAVIVGSPNVNEGYQLVGNANYPGIAEDYQRGFDILKALPCDLFLGAHGSYFGMLDKRARAKVGAANPLHRSGWLSELRHRKGKSLPRRTGEAKGAPRMNTRLLAFAMTLGFAVSPGHAASEAELRSAVASLAQALQTPDSDAWVYHYTEDAMFVAPASPPLQGRAAFLEMARTMGPLRQMKINIERMEVNNNLGYTYVRASWLSGDDPATEQRVRVRSLLVWRKDADGQWRVTQELLHADPEAQ